jgi:iron complex transport system permease protein
VGARRFALLLAAAWIASGALGLLVGGAHLTPGEVAAALTGRGEESARAILWELRLPRVALGFLVGGALAVAGAALQALIKNPLADPYLLGLSGGSGLGAVLAIVIGIESAWALPGAAFVGSILTIAVVYRLALVAGGALDSRILLLAGVVVGAFAGALVSGLLAVSEATGARSAMLWLMGGLGGVGWAGVGALALYSVPALGVLAREARTLDLLALGEEPAQHLGAEVAGAKRRVYVSASLLTAAAVAAAGIIGFVGLVVPHAIRMMRGHPHRGLLPSAFLLGGAFVVAADAGARTLFDPLELPVGVLTAVVGVPLFALLLRRTAGRAGP